MLRIMCIKDIKSNTYHRPFCVKNEYDAIRDLRNVIARGENVIADYPEDFELRYLGEFDEETGLIDTNDNRVERLVVTGSQLKLDIDNKYKKNVNDLRKENDNENTETEE